mgnify:CR=1 FL=1
MNFELIDMIYIHSTPLSAIAECPFCKEKTILTFADSFSSAWECVKQCEHTVSVVGYADSGYKVKFKEITE